MIGVGRADQAIFAAFLVKVNGGGMHLGEKMFLGVRLWILIEDT